MQKGKFNVILDQAWGSSGKGKTSAYLADKYKIEYLSSSNFPNAGHCQTGDTVVITDRGLETLGDVVKRSEAVRTVNMNGVFEEVSDFVPDGKRVTNQIILKNGVKLECTDIHMYYVWDSEEGRRKWVRSMDLDEHVHQFLMPKSVEFPNNSLISEFKNDVKPNKTAINRPESEEKFAEYLGLLVGDGYYAKKTRVDIAFSTNQLDTMGVIKALYDQMGIPHTESRVGEKECMVLSTSSTSGLMDLFAECGLPIATKEDKRTPEKVKKSNKKIMAAYLRGLFDSDGSAKSDRVSLTNCSSHVIRDAQNMLFVLGINSGVTKYDDKPGRTGSNRKPQHVLSVSGKKNLEAFRDTVGFMSQVKNDRLQKCIESTEDQGYILKINKSLRSVTRNFGIGLGSKKNTPGTRTTHILQKRKELEADASLMEMVTVAEEYHVISIKHIIREFRTEEVFDVTVPGTHSYIANGCISHNTAVVGGRSFVAKSIPTALILKGALGQDITGFISPGSGFDPARIIKEWIEAGKPQVFIHERASIVTGEHAAREREGAESTKHIASTMQGSGTAYADKILRKADVKLARSVPVSEWSAGLDITEEDKQEAERKIIVLSADAFRDATFAAIKTKQKTWLHEGSQGYALSIDHGSHYPNCTSRNCTIQAAMDHMAVPPALVGDVYLNLRTFPIRVGNVVENGVQHGFSGDFYSDCQELTWDQVAQMSGMPPEEAARLAERERTTVTKRIRRVSNFSWIGLRDAVRVNGVTKISVNFIQYLDWSDAGLKGGKDAFNTLSRKSREFIDKVEAESGVPVVFIGTGAKHDEMIDLE